MVCFWLVWALFSCSKESTEYEPIDISNPQPVGSFSFSVNGTTYTWKEERDTASATYLNMGIYPDWSGYTLHAGTNLHPNSPYRLINLPIPTQTLSVHTPFTFIISGNTPNLAVAISTAATKFYDPSVDYRAYPGDQVTVTLTRLKDNRANGTFSAKLTRSSDASKVSITAGSFENIRVDR